MASNNQNLLSIFRSLIQRSSGSSSDERNSQTSETQRNSLAQENQRNDSNEDNSPVELTRNVLHSVWNRLQSLSSNERNLLLNSGLVRNSGESQAPIIGRRRYRFYDEVSQSEEDFQNIIDDEYIDFRTYPIQIDWKEVENDQSDAYEICETYGMFGLSVFTSLTKKCQLKFVREKFPLNLLNFYAKYIEKPTPDNLVLLNLFCDSLPKLSEIRFLIIHGMINEVDLLIVKIVLDIYDHYFFNFENLLSKNYNNEFVPTFSLFYSCLTQQEIASLYEKISANEEIKKILANKLKAKVFEQKVDYLKAISKEKIEKSSLVEGLEENQFLL